MTNTSEFNGSNFIHALYVVHQHTIQFVDQHINENADLIERYFDTIHTAVAIDNLLCNDADDTDMSTVSNMLMESIGLLTITLKRATSIKLIRTALSLIDTLFNSKLKSPMLRIVKQLIAMSGAELMYALMYGCINSTIDARERVTQTYAMTIQTILTSKRSGDNSAQ